MYKSPKSPKNSTNPKKDDLYVLDILRQQLAKFQSSDFIFIIGDFTETELDFTAENENDFHFLPEGYELDIINSSRINKNLYVNEYERQSKGLCITSRLLILNGRARGDFQGHITYVGYHGCSTVHLILSSEPTLLDPAIFQYLPIFQILNISSHHKPDLLKLFVNNCKNQCSAYSDFFNSKKFCKKRKTCI